MPTGIDIDNTIANTDVAALARLNRRFGTRHSREHLSSVKLDEALRLSAAESSYLAALFADPEFYLSLKPLYRAVEGVNLLAEADEVVYVTARPSSVAEATVQWLDRAGFPVGGLQIGVRDKAIVGQLEGCEAFVEDDPAHVRRVVRELAVPVYMIECPWNRTFRHHLVTPVRSWAEIIDLVEY